jgi:hypothetical protein
MVNEEGAVGEMTVGGGKSNCSEKTYPCAILSTKNSTYPDPAHSSENPVINLLSYGMALAVSSLIQHSILKQVAYINISSVSHTVIPCSSHS